MTYSSLSDVCSFYVNGSPEGLCSCIILGEDYFGMHRRVSDMLYTRTNIAFCGGCSPSSRRDLKAMDGQ